MEHGFNCLPFPRFAGEGQGRGPTKDGFNQLRIPRLAGEG